MYVAEFLEELGMRGADAMQVDAANLRVAIEVQGTEGQALLEPTGIRFDYNEGVAVIEAIERPEESQG